MVDQLGTSKEKGSVAVLTRSPYKAMLEISEKEKADKESLKKKTMDDKKKKGPSPTAKACLKLKAQSRSKPKENANKVTTPPSQSQLIPTDWCCIYSIKPYSNTPDDGWVECITCKERARDECSGVDTDEDVFECDVCKPQ
ncbi:hypothetical protein HOLleu_09582 [Holothuria leucospilota]|uniref:Uncharacterized protein n=1 Tax=Holothuria leucospilota TaxID=206669 RepID=A0A9Q1CDW8_HOLLE|nr:hypothetical protein HOLleu_09582 [Holothuria leucospilota]